MIVTCDHTEFHRRIAKLTGDYLELVQRLPALIEEAEARGAEDMRERAAKLIESKHTNNVGMVHPMAQSDAAAIRALPVEEK